MKLSEMEAVVEAMLFLTGEEVSLETIAGVLEMDKATTKAVVRSLKDQYEAENRGLRIIEAGNTYRMSTAPFCFGYLREAYRCAQRQGLSQSLLETLAIIAYKQPVTKGEIEEIRGVSADHAINKLVEKQLIEEIGRKDTPGKPILFGTTNQFLRYFGYTSLDQLPPLEKTEE